MTEQPTPAEGQTATPKERTRDEIVRGAYSKAASTLRETHREEFNDLVKKYAKEDGVDWTPKKTKEEKDREAFEALLAANPQFAEIAQQS